MGLSSRFLDWLRGHPTRPMDTPPTGERIEAGISREPRLYFFKTERFPECMFCGDPCDPARPGVCSNREGNFPTLYFHGACATGLDGILIHAVYLETVFKMFRLRGQPLVRTG